MSKGAQNVHGISVEMSDKYGFYPGQAFELFIDLAKNADRIIAHNISFDWRLLTILATRLGPKALKDMETLKAIPKVCTMKTTTQLCKLPFPKGGRGYKWPKLEELHHFLFNEKVIDAHDALADVNATIRCYDELVKRRIL
jgi:DNA polymerase III epsilon subunit-like protein